MLQRHVADATLPAHRGDAESDSGVVGAQRWDGANDYYSLACIKLARAENGGDNGIANLDYWWHNSGHAGGTTNTQYYNWLDVFRDG